MTDLTKLAAEVRRAGELNPGSAPSWEKVERFVAESLERLEQCEAALKHLAAITDADCNCHEDFKGRKLRDPACAYHQYKWVFEAARAALEKK